MNRTEANKKLKRTNIKGKEYVEVNQRILAFWEMYPNGRITTELVSDDGERCLFRACVIVDGAVCATGHAFESKNASAVNRSSYIENCETSAIGRALGIFGIGITESIASAEEVANAIEQQSRKPNSDAKKQLWEAEKRAFELYGYASAKEFHKQAIETRADWDDSQETMLRIAAEITEGLNEKH